MLKTLPIIFLFASPSALADIGPKPTQYYQWKNKGKIDESSIQLLQCKDSECKESEPLKKIGPQDFHCCITGCFSVAYGYSVVSQLEGKVDGRSVKSKPFTTEGMNNFFLISEFRGKILVTKSKVDFSEQETMNIRTCQIQDPGK